MHMRMRARPMPVPPPVTVSPNCWGGENVAVTLLAWSRVTWHVPVPVQAPPHPLKLWPVAAVAVSVTCVPLG